MKYQKPKECSGCSLEHKPSGFIPASGPPESELLLIGEAGGWDEQREGKPFVGASGSKLNNLLKRVGLDREELRVHNLLSCTPPNNELRGAPYEYNAIKHCKVHLEPTLREAHSVIVAVGALAAKNLLGYEFKKAKANDLHGTVNWVARPELNTGGYYVIPTFHPSFLLRGNQKLTGVVLFDLAQAKKVLTGSYVRRDAKLHIDPELSWFIKWVDKFLASVASGAKPWLAVDTETVEKLTGKEEDELEGSNTQIIRINFAFHPDEGVTVPWVSSYIEQVRRLFSAKEAVFFFHNARYDLPLLREAGLHIEGEVHDTMNLFKMLQSDLPQGLGFIAPFYSTYGPWKHLNEQDPGKYAAIDPVQTLRIALGTTKDLHSTGQYEAYRRHIYQLDTIVLHPAEEIGLLVDPERLRLFKQQLEEKEAVLEAKIKETVGPEARPFVGKRKTPKEGFIAREVEELIWWCNECNQEVTEKHPKCSARIALLAPTEPKAKKPRKKRKNSIIDTSSASGLFGGAVSAEEPPGGAMAGSSGDSEQN